MNKPISTEEHPACCACGSLELQEHHKIRRSQGGKDGPTLWFCDKHHRNLTENIWDVQLDDVGYRIVDKHTGEVLAERYFTPEGFDPGKFVENLGAFAKDKLVAGVPMLEVIRHDLRYLPQDGLFQVYEDAGGYLLMGSILQAWAAQEYLSRFVHGEMEGAVATLAKQLDCNPRTIYNRLALARIPLHHVATLKELPISALVEASKAKDVPAATEFVIDRTMAGEGSKRIEAELRAIRKGEDYQEPTLVPCPTCGHLWRGYRLRKVQSRGDSCPPLDN